MSQLQFKQITFTNEDARGRRTGRLLSNDQYKIFRYPLDIGSYDKGHYMVIHINEQTHSNLSSGGTTSDNPTVIQNRINGTGTSSGQAISTAFQGAMDLANYITDGASRTVIGDQSSSDVNPGDQLRNFLLQNGGPVVDFAVGAGGAFLGQLGDVVNQIASAGQTDFARTIRRTKDTIVLYMPDTMAFTYNQGYNELNVGADARLLGAIGVGAKALSMPMPKASAEQRGEALAQQLSPFLLSFLADRTDLGRVAFAATQGRVLNPMIELLYTTPQLRSFSFNFAFYPRSEEEAKEINRILDCLRFHQSPEVATEQNGAFLIPPSEFDIKFYYNGKENTNIDKISTCVLESIDVDYAPNGFSAYEVQGQNSPTDGGTGMPVAIVVRLNFKETEYLTKKHYENYHTDRESRVADGGAFGSVPDAPYRAFDDANRAGLTISQGPGGIFDNDLPTPTNNFRDGT